MFRKRSDSDQAPPTPAPVERVTSVLGEGISWRGDLSGTGGIRIEGAFNGEINLRGMLVVGETGRITGKQIRANVVIVAGAVQADITAEKVEIRSTGRVWGNVVAAAFATEEGAFLRGQIQMEDKVDLGTPSSEAVTQPSRTAKSEAAQSEERETAET